MDLIIVESPSKAKTISKYLKGKYKVDASAGHIRDLPVHSLGVDIKNDFQPRYVNSEGKEDLIRRLQDETKKPTAYTLQPTPTAKEKRFRGICRRCWGWTKKRKTVSNSTKYRKKPWKRRLRSRVRSTIIS